jgi:hypothetical protein
LNAAVGLYAAQRVVRQSLGLIVATIALNITAHVMKSNGVGFVAGLIGVIALSFSIVGVFRAGEALRYSMLGRIGLALLMVLPIVNVATLVVIDGRLTRRLRTA